MPDLGDQIGPQGPERGADPGPQATLADRRRPSVATFGFEPDPRRLRTLLDEVEAALGPGDALLQRNVRLLVGEIVARLTVACPDVAVRLGLEVMADSVRVEIASDGAPCEFWSGLDDALFSDLTSSWGRDRRSGGGAWFEIRPPVPSGPTPHGPPARAAAAPAGRGEGSA